MSETIWLLSQSGNCPTGKFSPPRDDWEDKDAATIASIAYIDCESLSPDQFPKRLVEIKEIIEHEEDYVEAGLAPPSRKLFPLPNFFTQMSCYTFVNEPTAELLSGFDLGRTELHKLSLFAHDGKTPYDECAYWLNMMEAHPCFDAERSDQDIDFAGYVDILDRGKTKRWMPLREDDQTVLSGPLPHLDLWRDPQMPRAFFVRDCLAEALKKQKGGKKLRFLRCKVVES